MDPQAAAKHEFRSAHGRQMGQLHSAELGGDEARARRQRALDYDASRKRHEKYAAAVKAVKPET